MLKGFIRNLDMEGLKGLGCIAARGFTAEASRHFIVRVLEGQKAILHRHALQEHLLAREVSDHEVPFHSKQKAKGSLENNGPQNAKPGD